MLPAYFASSFQPAFMKEAGFSQVETGETRFSGFPGHGFAMGSIGRAGEGKTAV
jgi:hypothetical protein